MKEHSPTTALIMYSLLYETDAAINTCESWVAAARRGERKAVIVYDRAWSRGPVAPNPNQAKGFLRLREG